ncbi:MAG: transporter [Pseudomonadota bacterium]
MKRTSICAAIAATLVALPAVADGSTASDHAPIGVMADHRHEKGEVMLSYRYMRMEMDGSRIGTNSVTPEEIVTTVPNVFFGTPDQPPTLRVVPTNMTMEMHMFGGMYGVTDRLTLMGMTSYVRNEMDHITFMGPMGTTELGNFTTVSDGIGDTIIGAIYGLDNGKKAHRQINLNFAVSIPTGKIGQEDDVLTPMGTTPTLRLPYPMQIGSGTFDLKPGLTARDRFGDISIGGQIMGTFRIGDNSSDYSRGNIGELTTWVAYEPRPWVSLSGRLLGRTVGRVDGFDPQIVAPVQTANPDFQGGETLEALFGVNLLGQTGVVRGHRLAFEFGFPLVRDLNGPQLETDYMFTLGWQKAF